MDFFENRFQSHGFRLIAGIDEVGRGPLAGPVVAAAVILPIPALREQFLDSKKLRPEKRESLYEKIQQVALSIGTGVIEAKEIDRINIGEATQKAMAMAVHLSRLRPDMLLIDGILPVPLPLPQRTIVRGDNISVSIAAASIVAKVTRDRIMTAYHEKYPHYNFAQHKGYGTQEHREAIRRHGYCEYHRTTFRGVKGTSGLPTR
ncbi:MAG: ribonuclease HII [Proteobacteria bacterium]|nr:ribonuclease HII [Pseudomonadota bacterium]